MANCNQFTIAQQSDYLALAVRAARKAGKYLRDLKKDQIKVSEEISKDIKLVADRESEAIIVNELLGNSDFNVLAEESGVTGDSRSVHSWIVDPLDGSVNFLENIPLCCISIGLWHDSGPLFGVIYDFNRNDMYTGIVNECAWLNGQPISVKQKRGAESSILCTGFPVAMDFSSANIMYFISQIKTFRKIRMIGSASMSLAYVASGKVDAYFEKNIKIWDVAAGLAIVKAAGGAIQYHGFPASYLIDVFAGASMELYDNNLAIGDMTNE
ncbi:MAG: inositol monophosphatase [Planctomycetes bacterium]|uniref:inositol monophosphatase family protein n=1 Tax=Candidatus Wunengus sp. YC65 TaxID=3367701 RepID=UPI001D612A3A|nr:inositol monophosphatase [Planctomycetota bacterium]